MTLKATGLSYSKPCTESTYRRMCGVMWLSEREFQSVLKQSQFSTCYLILSYTGGQCGAGGRYKGASFFLNLPH